jgi:hypothetical protein
VLDGAEERLQAMGFGKIRVENPHIKAGIDKIGVCHAKIIGLFHKGIVFSPILESSCRSVAIFPDRLPQNRYHLSSGGKVHAPAPSDKNAQNLYM